MSSSNKKLKVDLLVEVPKASGGSKGTTINSSKEVNRGISREIHSETFSRSLKSSLEGLVKLVAPKEREVSSKPKDRTLL